MSHPRSQSTSTRQGSSRWWAGRFKDLVITLILWCYFALGFILFFSPFYLFALCFTKDRQSAFQRMNSRFYRGFFKLCRMMIPRQSWDIQDQVRTLRSAVIVCNHISYLDSILLISLFPHHTTIAKDRLFGIPLFGRMLALSGYIPSSGRGRYAGLLINSMEEMRANLKRGGNIIVFPEGTRSRDGRVGRLYKGIFKIARYCRAPIKVVNIRNSDKLFTPGRFAFNTCDLNTIYVKLVAELNPAYESPEFNINNIMDRVYELLDGQREQSQIPSR